MKETKLKWKKAMVLTLAFNMIAGLFPAMPNAMATVQAEKDTSSSTGSTPSVTAFATKDELMTKFDLDGTDDTVGKLVFGKNSSKEAQEWYIAGTDSGVSGNNIVIFAASDIATLQVFEEDKSTIKTDSKLWEDCTYLEGTTITEVNPNHYGASDLRVVLKKMAEDISYFTENEQSLMNKTTVKTYDKKNDVSYTTTDILYALKGDDTSGNNQILWAGSDDSKVIAMEPYWSGGVFSGCGRLGISAITMRSRRVRATLCSPVG